MTFTEDFNTSINELKTTIEELHTRSKEQVTSFIQKSGSSYTELLNILKRDTLLEDTFVDGSKIAEIDQLSYDRDGWTNSFVTTEVPFLNEYYTSTTYPMVMDGGRIIPGSDFSKLFLDREGFWGYMKDDDISTPSEFSLTFKLKNNQPVSANRIYLRTNNILDVECFYRPDFGEEWVSLGSRGGRHHVWTAPFVGVEIKFSTTTTMFAISFVAVCEAIFAKSGSFTSTYYTVDDLRKLRIDVDADIPAGTNIRKFINITNTIPNTVPDSGWIEWNGDDVITLSTIETLAPVESGYIIPSGYVQDSIVLRKGYREWDNVTEVDYPLVTESIERLGTNYLDIPAGYMVVQDGVASMFIGDGDSRTNFTKDEDYTVTYNTDADTVLVTNIPGGRLDGILEHPYAEIRIRKPISVVQRRTFVYLENDNDIVVSIPTPGITLRSLHIGDTIENEITIENIETGEYTIEGKSGLTLVEVENFDSVNAPQILSVYDYFSSRYWLRESESIPPETNEYYLDPAESGFKLVAIDTNLYLRYLIPTDYNNVAISFELEGTEQIAPLLRGYELVNTIDKI